ncbi:MAG: preprotein translocase subunit YajC [Sphingomonas sp.]|uniref:preprotein translocase subunit YajC n=1 Tax=Sphingomonas sp. TaxID=28214 RepID=UPI001AD220ED|nr:preprotein translocase subunit YajC [Sphingomonas sp.]MBN8806660.1 preprotein translocase subunit YajC [Sphingomonas sp.]
MLIPSAYAQAAATAPAPAADAFGGTAMFLMQMLLIGVVFYFLMIRPQQKRAKALRDSLAAIKKNDQVITSGGILGKVSKVADPYVELEVAQGVKIQVVKATITEVIQPVSNKPAND